MSAEHGPALRAAAARRIEQTLPLHVRVYNAGEVTASVNLLAAWLSTARVAGVQLAVVAGPLADIALAAIGSTRTDDRRTT